MMISPLPPAATLRHGAALLVGIATLMLLDRQIPLAGLVVMLLVTLTIGFLHGAADILLLRRLAPRRRNEALVWLAYLALVVAAGALLARQAGYALVLLLALSAWHFGEPFAGADASAGASVRDAGWGARLVLRLLRGGAPVVLPVWLAWGELEPLLGEMAPAGSLELAFLSAFWRVLAGAWAALAAVWLVVAALARQYRGREMRLWVAEVIGLSALYLLLSPLMAFAVFFGVYHSGGHVLRVARAEANGSWQALVLHSRVTQTVGLTLLLGLALFASLQALALDAVQASLALRAAMVALTALSVPHVVLITWWAGQGWKSPG